MVRPVFFLSHHLQIVWVIVCPILVTMVDNFMPIKFTTGDTFNDDGSFSDEFLEAINRG